MISTWMRKRAALSRFVGGWAALAAALLLGAGGAAAMEKPPCFLLVSTQKQRPNGDLPHIRARINGKPVLLTLDTGFNFSGALTRNAAARIGLTPVPSGEAPSPDFTGTPLGEELLLIDSLSIGGLTVEQTPMLLIPTDELFEYGQRMDGKLGAAILLFLDLHFDKASGSLDLLRNTCPERDPEPPEGVLRLKLIERNLTYLIPARVGPAKGYALIDTGTTLSVIFSDCVGDLLAGRKPLARVDTISFSGRSAKVDLYKLDKIILDGKMAVTGPTFIVMDRVPQANKDVCFLLGISFFRTPVIKSMTLSPSTSSLYVQVK